MNVKTYIESGILELYAMGQLGEAESTEVAYYLDVYPELAKELEQIEISLEQYAIQNGIKPSAQLKAQIIASMVNLQQEKEMDLANLPLINKHSDYKNWLKLIADFGKLPLDNDGRHLRVLRQDEEVMQVLIISTTDIEQEVHLVEHESFLILEGECKCTVGDKVRLMSAGDFMQIPLFENHDVQLISPQVTAILQRVRA